MLSTEQSKGYDMLCTKALDSCRDFREINCSKTNHVPGCIPLKHCAMQFMDLLTIIHTKNMYMLQGTSDWTELMPLLYRGFPHSEGPGCRFPLLQGRFLLELAMAWSDENLRMSPKTKATASIDYSL